jgi:pimeloyl-ACP methyl ester carboxylesterase
MKHAILLSLMLAAFAPAHSADMPAQPNRFAATIAPAERFEVEAMLVERHGEVGTPLILVPGLASGAWVWQDTVRRLKERHVVYIVTLPGFDGRPASAGPAFEGAQKAVAQLIANRKLVKPVVIGHSLGGILGIAMAQRHPDLLGGVVAIDGLPVFPGTEGMAPPARAQMVEGIKQRMANLTPAIFAAQQQQYMRGIGVTDIARADELAKLSARSDPAATTAYLTEVLELDLRAGLVNIKAPVLVIAPWFEADGAQSGQLMADKVAHYTDLMSGTPKLDVVALPGARHFVMFDQPEALAAALDRYLKSL